MSDFRSIAKIYKNPEEMAADFLTVYFDGDKIEYPINPFEMLKKENIIFVIRNFNKLEGVYVPAQTEEDIDVVGINANRPITRQRFTAAHELCHHFRDYDRQVVCEIGKKDPVETFAEAFAAALLMPIEELRNKVNEYKDRNGSVSFDDVLKIADFFGVSFEACLFRIAYKLHAIEGETEANVLKKRIAKYKPDVVRKVQGLTYTKLYADLIDNYVEQLSFSPDKRARYIFENEYIYNDSRMEGLNVSLEEASEIVTDLRMHSQNSEYCKEGNEPYMSVAGHYKMYQDIFRLPVKETISVYDAFILNKNLFSYYPNPEFGGNTRQNNVLVLGAKFETVDYYNIFEELTKVDIEIKDFFSHKNDMPVSEYIKHIVRIHHKLTVIHPFPEGNGRTLRAFMNIQLVRAGLTPVYIKVEEKDVYIKALEKADEEHEYDELYEFVFKVLIRSHIELSS